MYGWTLSTILSILVRGTTYSIHSSSHSEQSLHVERFVIINCSKGPSVSVELLQSGNENGTQLENFTSSMYTMVSSADTCCEKLAFNTTVANADSQVVRKMVNSSKEIVICEGTNVELFCNVTSSFFPQISWRKNEDIFPGDSLVLSNVQRGNHGTYWCEVSGNGSAVIAKMDIILIVEFPPVCLIIVPNIEILEVDDAHLQKECVLHCIVEAFPLPTITWYKEDTELEEWFFPQLNVTSYEVDYYTTLSELRIVVVHNGTLMDNQLGNYTCRAMNKHGTSSAEFHLIAACESAAEIVSDGYATPASRNVTGFIIGMVPPLVISFYLIIQLGYRSQFADERADQQDGYRPDFVRR